ncbi:MAG TPA: DUF4260 domain-containing protein [Anaerolineales bacterium]|jgi:hypothetical protein|nr:DUF4260 domain-containing protein [Anaerolineales bacterium]
MKYLLKLEEAMMFLFSIFLFSKLDYAWWWYPLLILTPDLSMAGYLVGPKVGAFTYNLAHHKALSIGLYILGIMLANQPLQLVGLILFGHSSMDRVLGYGLKYADAFEHTHLGMIGRANA